MESLEIVNEVKKVLEDKRAIDVEVYNVENKSILTDYYVICQGTSNTHIKALANEVEDALEKMGLEKHHVEGMGEGRWVLLDFGVVIINVMHQQEREYYDLDAFFQGKLQ